MILADIALSVGLPEAEAKNILESRSFKKQVEADWQRSLKLDPDVVPILTLNDELLVLPQQCSLIESFMEKYQVKKQYTKTRFMKMRSFDMPDIYGKCVKELRGNDYC